LSRFRLRGGRQHRRAGAPRRSSAPVITRVAVRRSPPGDRRGHQPGDQDGEQCGDAGEDGLLGHPAGARPGNRRCRTSRRPAGERDPRASRPRPSQPEILAEVGCARFGRQATPGPRRRMPASWRAQRHGRRDRLGRHVNLYRRAHPNDPESVNRLLRRPGDPSGCSLITCRSLPRSTLRVEPRHFTDRPRSTAVRSPAGPGGRSWRGSFSLGSEEGPPPRLGGRSVLLPVGAAHVN